MTTEDIKKKYNEIVQALEASPDKDAIIKWWNDHTVDIKGYIRFQFLDEDNILPLDILKPEPDKVIKIRLKGFEYYVPMKDIAHMGDGNREPWLIKELSVLKEGDIFFDVGANLGLFTIPAAKKAKVFAFEPEDANYELLSKTVALNGVADNVQIIKKALSDSVGETTFYTHPYGSFSGMGNPEETHGNWQPLKKTIVPTTTIDAIVREYNLDKIDWMKIDVEGAEVLVMKGAAESLGRKIIKNILIEMHTNTLQGTKQEDIYFQLAKTHSIVTLWRDKNNPMYHYLKATIR